MELWEEELIMGKIQMTTPLVEMDGDEMTRILWQMIRTFDFALCGFKDRIL